MTAAAPTCGCSGVLAVAAEQVVNCAVVRRAEVWQFCCSGVVVVVVSRVAEVRRWCRDDGGAAGVQWWREAAQVHGSRRCRCRRGGDGDGGGTRSCWTREWRRWWCARGGCGNGARDLWLQVRGGSLRRR